MTAAVPDKIGVATNTTMAESVSSASHDAKFDRGAPTRHAVKTHAARAWRMGWAAFLTFCTVTGLVAFWPRLSVSMISTPDQAHWHYVVNNGSFFAVTDVVGNCTIVSAPVGWQGGTIQFRDIDAFSPQRRRLIRPEDSHTFNCPSYVAEDPSMKMHGKVDIHLTYRYAYLFTARMHACYELESNIDKTRIWIRQACP